MKRLLVLLLLAGCNPTPKEVIPTTGVHLGYIVSLKPAEYSLGQYTKFSSGEVVLIAASTKIQPGMSCYEAEQEKILVCENTKTVQILRGFRDTR